MSALAPSPAPVGVASRPSRLTEMLSWPLVLLLRGYQLLISPLLPSSCRYYPSCSAYALESVRRFGPLVGLWLAIRRLARCHPWAAGGVDHVPPRGGRGYPDWAAHRRAESERQAGLDAALDVGEACPRSGSPRPKSSDTIGGQPSRPRGMH